MTPLNILFPIQHQHVNYPFWQNCRTLLIYNAINVLGAEVSDPVYQLRLITNQMDATKDFRDICKDVFKDMRRLMKQ